MALFVLMMMYFFSRALIAGGEKVPDKYYEKGNKFQEVLDEERDGLEFKPSVTFQQSAHQVLAKFDSLQPDSGLLRLQWPPDASKAVFTRFTKTAEGNCSGAIPLKAPQGNWIAELTFYKNGHKYFYKHKVWVE